MNVKCQWGQPWPLALHQEGADPEAGILISSAGVRLGEVG